jgi:hypothetical protein
MNDYNCREKQEIERCYNLDQLARKVGYAEEDIRVIQEYIILVKAQIGKVESTKFAEEVHLKRSEYGGVDFYVSLHHVPDVPKPDNADYNWHLSYPITEDKSFSGKERSQAIKYAEMLAAEHNAPIVKEGYWPSK